VSVDDQAKQTNSTGAAGGSTHLDLEGPILHAIRRSILERLSSRMAALKFGFTFIQRGQNGAVENIDLEPFDSFAECCAAAERATHAGTAQSAERVEVVPCHYDEGGCCPQVMFVLKTFKTSS
jgi:hypothetical protein